VSTPGTRGGTGDHRQRAHNNGDHRAGTTRGLLDNWAQGHKDENVTDALADLQRRVAALEERLHMESGLRAGGDHELADMARALRAQQHTMQALAVTQSQNTEILRRVVDGQQQIVTLLTHVIGRNAATAIDEDADYEDDVGVYATDPGDGSTDIEDSLPSDCDNE
jgi:hypothetical protein